MEMECEKWNDNAFACSEGKTNFWEKTCNFSKWRKTDKQAHKTKTKEKNISLKTTQNMPRCNALQRWNSNLEHQNEGKLHI